MIEAGFLQAKCPLLHPANCVGVLKGTQNSDTNQGKSLVRSCHFLDIFSWDSWQWLGSWVVSVLDSGAEGPGFKSRPRRCRVTVLGKLFAPIVPLFTKQQNGTSPLKGYRGNCRPGGQYWQPTAGFMTYVTCRLTAKNWDQLQNPTVSNRVWATFTFYLTEETLAEFNCVWISLCSL